MMTFEFRRGVRDKTSVLIALAGPTGCGKTFTAILMAIGIAYPRMKADEIIAMISREGHSRVFMIDSEGGRGLHYCPGPGIAPDFRDTFPYEYGEITAPYTPERYSDAVKAAEDAGALVIIIDSMSHEYESEGGILEIADQIERGTPKPGIEHPRDPYGGGDSWKDWIAKPVKSPGQWNEPKSRHKKMVNRMIQSRAHLIFCLRAEEKMLLKMEPMLDYNGQPKMGRNGPIKKTVIVPAEDRPLIERWSPICEKRFMYEMTASFLLLAGRPGYAVPIKPLQGAFKKVFSDTENKEGDQLGITHGEALADWSVGRKAGMHDDQTIQSSTQPEKPSQPDQTPKSEEPSQPRESKKEITTAEDWADDYIAKVKATSTMDGLRILQEANDKSVNKLQTEYPDLFTRVAQAEAEQQDGFR